MVRPLRRSRHPRSRVKEPPNRKYTDEPEIGRHLGGEHARQLTPRAPEVRHCNFVGRRWSIADAVSIRLYLPGDCRRMPTDPPGDLGPSSGPVLDHRNPDFFAFKQRQRRTGHGVVSIGRCWSTAPVIMTGTVHRPMELTPLDCPENESVRGSPTPKLQAPTSVDHLHLKAGPTREDLHLVATVGPTVDAKID
jgi:hypothetical protein